MAQMISTLSGQPPSRFGFGTMQFGDGTPENDCAEIYDICRTSGINIFDTAHVYTGGASEKILGALIKKDRDDIVLMTKCAYVGSSSAQNIKSQFDESRRRLGQEMVDVLFLHRFDPSTPLEKSFEALAELKSSGDIRAIGVSNFAAWQVMKAKSIAAQFGCDVDVIQPMYSLVKRQVEVELLPMCASEDIAVTPYSPLGGGLLTGKYRKGSDGRLVQDERYKARYDQDWFRQTAEDLSEMADRLNLHPATLAVAWVGAHPAISAPLISGKTPEQLKPSLDAISLDLSPEDYAALTALSQTPAPATDRLEEA